MNMIFANNVVPNAQITMPVALIGRQILFWVTAAS